MENLFNEYEAYTKAGRDLSDEVTKALDPIFERWVKDGHKIRDIESIMSDEISIIGAILRMERGIAAAKSKR